MGTTFDTSDGYGSCAIMKDEAARLCALHRYQILDSSPEPQFDRLVSLARRALGVPMVVISLIDQNRQWFKARIGVDDSETPRSIAFCDHTIRQRGVMVVRDARTDHRFAGNPQVTGDPGIRFYAGAPLVTADGHALGTLCVIDDSPRDFGIDEQSILADLAAIVMDEMELRRANRELSVLAQTDPLTGALNRRTFFALAEREMARARRLGGSIAVLILDIDHFKRINDSHGHATGDKVLAQFSDLIAHSIRVHDVFARLGGEEFALILPDTTLPAALEVGERLRLAIEQTAIQTEIGSTKVTVSLGASEIEPTDSNIEPALRRADKALYRAKHCGRNKVIAA